jgi:pimeloyl-ACP methyl ester carboxylesterase
MLRTAGVTTGALTGGTPYLAIGAGPPLVSVQGLTPTHDVPHGFERRWTLASARPLTSHFRVVAVNRRPGLPPGASMSDIAGYLATAIAQDLDPPVYLTGTSTGGSVALQLAIDHPELVRALVVVAAAYRLGPEGRAVQRQLAEATRAGDYPSGMARVMTAMAPRPVRPAALPMARLVARSMAPADAGDLLATLDAEDAFDVGDRLDRITAPTLVIGGAKDVFYTPQLFGRTAAGVQDGRLHLFPTWGHGRTTTSAATATLTLGFLLGAGRN